MPRPRIHAVPLSAAERQAGRRAKLRQQSGPAAMAAALPATAHPSLYRTNTVPGSSDWTRWRREHRLLKKPMSARPKRHSI
jgi:hypothetical protein